MLQNTILFLQVEIKRAEPRTFHINGNSVKQEVISEQWAVQQTNGHAPSPMAPVPPPPHPHQPAPAPPPTAVTHHPNGQWTPNGPSYPAQYGSPPTMPPAQWSQPPPTPPTQWATYASPPPPSSVAPTFYPAPATPTPNYWAVGQTQSPSAEQQFSQKIGVYAGQLPG